MILEKQKLVMLFVVTILFSGTVGFLIGKSSVPSASSSYDVNVVEEDLGSENQNATNIGNNLNDNSDLVNSLKETLKKDPDNLQANVKLAYALFESRKFDKSIKYYKKAIELNPKDVDLYNDIGLAFHYTGKSKESIYYLEKGIEKAPFYQRIWLTKGFVYFYGEGDHEKAKLAWERVVSLDDTTQIAKAAQDYINQFNFNNKNKTK